MIRLENGSGAARRHEIAVDTPVCKKEFLARAGLEPGDDEPQAKPAQLVEPSQALDHALERGDAVAEARRVLVAKAFREVGHLRVQASERLAVEQVRELVGAAAAQRACSALGVRAPA